MTFVSLNVNGLRDANKRMAVLQWLGHLSVDFECLQETHSLSSDECTSWFSSYGYSSVVSPRTSHSCGSAILFRPCFSLIRSWTDSDGRFVMAELLRHGLTFCVVSLYAPNRNPQRDNFFAYCASMIDPSVPTLFCGDFNAVFDRALDRRGSNVFDASRESVRALGAVFYDCCMVDAWRVLHHSTVAFSWLKPDGSLASHIDLIGCPYSWLHHVLSCNMLPCPFSDHCAVVLNVNIPEPLPRGPGRWILNVSILKDADFKQIITAFWRNWQARKASFPSLLKWWDTAKRRSKVWLLTSALAGRGRSLRLAHFWSAYLPI